MADLPRHNREVTAKIAGSIFITLLIVGCIFFFINRSPFHLTPLMTGAFILTVMGMLWAGISSRKDVWRSTGYFLMALVAATVVILSQGWVGHWILLVLAFASLATLFLIWKKTAT